MALLFCDSFDHYATADLPAKWPNLSVGGMVVGAFGRRGGNGAHGVGSNNQVGIVVPSSPSTVVVGCACRVSVLGSVPLFLMIGESVGGHIALRVNADGSVSVCRLGSTIPNAVVGAVLGTTALGLIAANVYAYYELKVTIHDTAGTAELRLNGSATPALSLTAQDTRNGGTGVVSIFALTTQAGGTSDFDDVYLLDTTGSAPLNNFLGDVRVDARTVTGAGAVTQWTPSTGSNFQNVDDATPNGDTDYNSAASSGLVDTFAVQDSPVAGTAPLAVQLCVNVKKLDAGICTVAPVVRHAGSNNVAASTPLPAVYSYLVQPYSLNPGTGAAWTETDFNNAEFGYSRTA